VIAGRLAAADPSLRLLVLEAGPHTYGLPEHRQPARYLSHLQPNSETMTFNVARPSESVAGRAVVVPSAHCVGGGSSVNCMSTSLDRRIVLGMNIFSSHDVHSCFCV
jgi:alcohol oxidase